MRKVREHYSEIVARVPRLQLGFVAALVLIAASYWVVQVAHGEHYRSWRKTTVYANASSRLPAV